MIPHTMYNTIEVEMGVTPLSAWPGAGLVHTCILNRLRGIRGSSTRGAAQTIVDWSARKHTRPSGLLYDTGETPFRISLL